MASVNTFAEAIRRPFPELVPTSLPQMRLSSPLIGIATIALASLDLVWARLPTGAANCA